MAWVVLVGTPKAPQPETITGVFATEDEAKNWARSGGVAKNKMAAYVNTDDPGFLGKLPDAKPDGEIWTVPFPG